MGMGSLKLPFVLKNYTIAGRLKGADEEEEDPTNAERFHLRLSSTVATSHSKKPLLYLFAMSQQGSS